MDNSELHQREMNANAHFAWAMVLWGSGEAARVQNNLLPAAISYYYSAFHAGFSLLAIDPTYHLASMKRMGHTTLENWLEANLPIKFQMDFGLLREVRETINYLGVEDPGIKLRIVKGHEFGFQLGESKIKFPEMVDRSAEISETFIRYIRSELSQRGKKIGIKTPNNEVFWLDDYIGEDAFLSIVPNENSRKAILSAAFSLLN